VIPSTTKGLIHTARADRNFPGQGDIDLKSILDCIPNVPFSLEIPNERLMKRLGPDEYARQAIRAAEDFFKDTMPKK
jgi:sugar phosphate isomerase/epimerase